MFYNFFLSLRIIFCSIWSKFCLWRTIIACGQKAVKYCIRIFGERQKWALICSCARLIRLDAIPFIWKEPSVKERSVRFTLSLASRKKICTRFVKQIWDCVPSMFSFSANSAVFRMCVNLIFSHDDYSAKPRLVSRNFSRIRQGPIFTIFGLRQDYLLKF